MAIKDKFLELDAKRSNLLLRARECAKLTIPYVLPPEDANEQTVLPTPYQSVGAQGVNQLTSKLLMVLMPANVPFFKLEIPPAIIDAMGLKTDEINQLLMLIERQVMDYLDEMNIRAALAAAIRDLIITGNALLYFGKDKIRTFRLDNYVVERDASGNVIRLIVREGLSWEALPNNLKIALKANPNFNIENPEEHYKEQGVTLWTMAEWDGKNWVVTQEIENFVVNRVKYAKKNFPYLVLRWSAIAGESYGRGLVEQYLGDLKSLEALNEALVTGALQAARVVWLVRPGAVITAKDVQNAWHGDVLVGNPEDVAAIQLQKYADFQWVMVQAQQLEQRLAQVFFLIPSAIRDAERVTAEEIRLVSQELETALGGVYTLLTNELQKPLLELVLNRLINEGKIIDIDKYKNILEVKIITGFAGLGRNEDFNRLLMFIQSVAGLPEAGSYLNTEKIMKQIAVSLGIDPSLVRTEEERLKLMMQTIQQQILAQTASQAVLQQIAGQQVQGGEINEIEGQNQEV